MASSLSTVIVVEISGKDARARVLCWFTLDDDDIVSRPVAVVIIMITCCRGWEVPGWWLRCVVVADASAAFVVVLHLRRQEKDSSDDSPLPRFVSLTLCALLPLLYISLSALFCLVSLAKSWRSEAAAAAAYAAGDCCCCCCGARRRRGARAGRPLICLRMSSGNARALHQIVFLQIRLQDRVFHRREHESDVLRICGND